MERIKVNSTNLNSVGFLLGVLEVEFKNKSIYLYQNVPQTIFERFLIASPKGKFLNLFVVNKFRYKKVK